MSRDEWDAANAAQHGTTSMYTRHKCRCNSCRENWAAYWKAHRRNKRDAA